jgi:hypothetical protein
MLLLKSYRFFFVFASTNTEKFLRAWLASIANVMLLAGRETEVFGPWRGGISVLELSSILTLASYFFFFFFFFFFFGSLDSLARVL